MFPSARDAVRAVLAAQQALGAEQWGEATGPLAARMECGPMKGCRAGRITRSSR